MAESSNGIQAFALALDYANHSSNINSSINYIWIKNTNCCQKMEVLSGQSPKIPFSFFKSYITRIVGNI